MRPITVQIICIVVVTAACFLTLNVKYYQLAMSGDLENRCTKTTTRITKTVGTAVSVEEEQAACESFDKSITLLIEAIRSDTERTGLRPLRFVIDGADHHFGFTGLDANLTAEVFRGRKIIFAGDSTMFYMHKHLNHILNDKTSDLSALDLAEANAYVNPSGDKHLDLGRGNPPAIINETDGTHILWMGKSGPSKSDGGNFDQVWRNIMEVQPEVVVANMGLHWLHCMGHKREKSAPIVARWLNYEGWLDEIIANSREAGVKLVIFKTTNYVCDEQFYDSRQECNQKYRSKDLDTLFRCKEIVLEKKLVPATTTDEEIANFCQNGTFNEIGSAYLNQRLKTHLTTLDRTHLGLNIALFDDHNIQMCTYTVDGAHYHRLNLARIRVLANILKCHLRRKDKKI